MYIYAEIINIYPAPLTLDGRIMNYEMKEEDYIC